MKFDITCYEKIIQRKVYSDTQHEYAELKRQGVKIKKVSDEIRQIKTVLKQEINEGVSSKANEIVLLRKIRALETEILDRMKGGLHPSGSPKYETIDSRKSSIKGS